MGSRSTRRQFLQTGSLGAAGLAFLSQLPPVAAEDARVTPELVQLDGRIEPLVKLIEETSRDRVLEEVAQRIKAGTSYQEVLAALLLAAVRNVQPKPAVGFKFHAVLVINSCHIASLHGPDEDRWLPIFWAIDHFKSSQADEAKTSGWRMPPVKESLVPDAAKARELFVEAMENWDEEKADAATAGLARHAGATEVFNLFAQYAARDFRAIGHKVIFLANSWRTLQVIGWEHAEPVLRSLSAALMNHGTESNPATSMHTADRSWREHLQMASQLNAGWLMGDVDQAAPRNLLMTSRSGSTDDCAEMAFALLEKGVSPQSVWDGVFMSASELLMRQPGIVGLHGLTSANALHYVYQHASDDLLRRRLLLQAASFNAEFLNAAKNRGALKEITLEQWEHREPQGGTTVDDVLARITDNKLEASTQLYGYLEGGGDADQFMNAARRMIFQKGRDSHDYKFSSAVLEDYSALTPAWRNRFLALSVFNLKGSGDGDNGVVTRTRAALG